VHDCPEKPGQRLAIELASALADERASSPGPNG